jgi:transposase InsO family protein
MSTSSNASPPNPVASARDVRLRALRDTVENDPEVPSLIRTYLGRGAKLDDIRLDRRGRWWHEHGPVENERVARLFAKSLRRTERGTWLLEVAPYTYPVTVEGCGWFIDRWPLAGDPARCRLTDGSEAELAQDAVWTDGDVFFGARLEGGRWARFVGPAHARLLESVQMVGEAFEAHAGGARLRVQLDPALGVFGDPPVG